MIDKTLFLKLTGREDIQDDLERVNCSKVGDDDHYFCGWNVTKNAPAFCGRSKGDLIISGLIFKEGVK
jgi:hypothetical protein